MTAVFRTMPMARLASMVVLFLLFGASFLLGQTAREIQERMRERLPQIDALKREQIVGENRHGLLESLRQLDREQRRLVEQENQDRLTIYRALAEQSQVSPEQVARVRAQQIAERSAPGVMIQDDRGQWVEKR